MKIAVYISHISLYCNIFFWPVAVAAALPPFTPLTPNRFYLDNWVKYSSISMKIAVCVIHMTLYCNTFLWPVYTAVVPPPTPHPV